VTNQPTREPTRDELMAEWRAARRRRETAEPGGKDYIEASEEVARIEVEIARVERAADPPLG
jgi:hypothetical protein